MNNMTLKTFGNVNLKDPFFQSLRNDYPGFDKWFNGKHDEDVFVQYDDEDHIIGFLYLKIEYDKVNDVSPIIYADKILKVGTFKINAHGTKLGEQCIKSILDYAITENVDVCYVTIFPRHTNLINLVETFGFELRGKKGKENVYIKDMHSITGNIKKDFPAISINDTRKYLLGVYPQYHSIMFPDSILKTEDKSIIKDVSYTNSIYKIYVCSMRNVENLKHGDIVVLYRTAEYGKSAEYSAVATSVCVVDEVKLQSEFDSFEDFYTYASQYSVFDKADLKIWYHRGECKTIKLTYNAAFKQRIIRHDLIQEIGLRRSNYWGFFQLNDEQFLNICKKSGVSNLIK